MKKKNKESILNLFYEAFGKANSRREGKCWDELAFTDHTPKMVFRYVGWVDLMGASHMMRRSIDSASKSIGRLHEAVLKACFALKVGKRVTLHPLADGVYVVADSYEDIAQVLAHTFRSYAQTYLKMSSESRFCPIRAAVAYGRVVDQIAYTKKLSEIAFRRGQLTLLNRYFSNVLHGSAYAAAHEAEGKAPPFGIYQDESVREFGETKKEKCITWPLEKWWCFNRSATQRQKDFAMRFGQCLLEHFDWVAAHPIDSGMVDKDFSGKIEGFKRQIREYFGVIAP